MANMDGRYQDFHMASGPAVTAVLVSVPSPMFGWWEGNAAGNWNGMKPNRVQNGSKKSHRRGDMQQCQVFVPGSKEAWAMTQFQYANGNQQELAPKEGRHQKSRPQPQQQQMMLCSYTSPQICDVSRDASCSPYGDQVGIPLMMAPMLAPFCMTPKPGRAPAQDLANEVHFPAAEKSPRWAAPSPPAAQAPPMQPPTALLSSQGETQKWKAKDAEFAVAKLKGSDPVERNAVLEQVIEKTWVMALMRHGCHVVQAALDVASAPKQLALAGALRGHVWEALKSPHANHVLQRCIAVLPPGQIDFILNELQGRAVDAARHHFGCRILQRLLEHCTAEQVAVLVQEILGDLIELCRHPYGNYVVQHILEHGLPQQRKQVAEAIMPEVRSLARHKIASHVVQCVFMYCGEEDKNKLAGDFEELTRLQHSHYGSFVAKEMKRQTMWVGPKTM